MKRHLASLSALVLLVVLVSCDPAEEGAAPQPTEPRAGAPADDSLIAFTTQSRRDLRAKHPMPRVAVVAVAGGEVRRLRKGSSPAWSPDGTKLAFQCHPGICTMNADGTDVHRITDPPPGAIDEEPAWGSGARILFTRARSGHPASRDIFMSPGPSGRERRILGGPRNVFAPAWSPDGSRIAYIGAVGEGTEAPTGGFQLFVAPWGSVRDGRQLTVNGAASPDWSPDGASIVFDQASVIWVVPAGGGTPRRLAPATTGRHAGGVGAFASWSPDGERIVYMCQTGAFDDNDLCTMNADGTGRITVLDTSANEGVPAWQPPMG